MTFQPLSRPTTPANSVKGLAPFRTPRSRPGQQSSHSIFGSSVSHESRPVSRVSSRQHRRTSSTPEQPFAAPKSHVPLQIDRHQREPTSRASSPPVSGSHFSRQGHSIRSSLQSLARSGSFSLPKTPKGRRSTETPELIEDEDDHSDGSRFDLLSSDPFRSETPIAILDIEEPPPLPPKPLHIIPPAEVDVADEHLESPTPISDGSRTPTGATVAAMKSAFNRLTLSGKPRLRLLSFIKETRSPAADHEPSESPPKLQLPTFAGEPLFDVSGFQLPDLPAKKKSIHVEGRSLGHAAPPSLRMQPSGPAATSPIAGNLAGASALQLNLNGNEFEGYILETPLEADTTLGVPEPEPEPQPEPEPEPVVRRPMTPKEPPGWIVKFREELEVLAGEALSLTSLGDKLVLELPEEPGRNHRRTLVFQETDLDESTPELTSDSISISSHGRPPRPTRPPPPIPRDTPEEGSGAYIAELADNTWNPDANREACASLLSIHSSSTWDPSQPIPSIPDQDSSYFSSDDDQTIRAAEAPTQPHVFEPSVSKAELIEEAIRKIQRKAEASRLRVIEEDESEVESDASEEPIVVERGPTLTRHISNPFATNPAEEQVCRDRHPRIEW